jgi:hypothetical protein
VLETLAAVALGDVRAVFLPDDTLKPVHECSDVAAVTIARLDVVTTITEDGNCEATARATRGGGRLRPRRRHR